MALATSGHSGKMPGLASNKHRSMWFKNLRAFRLTSPFDLSPEVIHERLLGDAFTPCASTQPLSLGWVAPLGDQAELLVHTANGRHLVCMRREERLLPPAVVREMVQERLAEIGRAHV